jgi:hypothetical protein
MDESRPARRNYSSLFVRIGGGWIVAGAILKLLFGTPADLPAPVRNGSPIAAELAVGLLSLLHPRVAWPILSLVLLFFVAILVQLVLEGAKSCGCFGKAIPFPPGLMLAVDAACLLKILVSRPWSTIPASGLRPARVAPALVLSIVAPWFVLGPPRLASTPPPATRGDGGWKLPERIPRWVTFEPDRWIGQPIRETELGRWMDTDLYPPDAQWILYRINCPHCREHLRNLASGFDNRTLYVLIRLPEEGDEKEKVVDVKPPGIEVELPRGPKYAIETPWELRLEGGKVIEAVQHRPHGWGGARR